MSVIRGVLTQNDGLPYHAVVFATIRETIHAEISRSAGLQHTMVRAHGLGRRLGRSCGRTFCLKMPPRLVRLVPPQSELLTIAHTSLSTACAQAPGENLLPTSLQSSGQVGTCLHSSLNVVQPAHNRSLTPAVQLRLCAPQIVAEFRPETIRQVLFTVTTCIVQIEMFTLTP